MTDTALYFTIGLTVIGAGLVGFIVGVEVEATRWRRLL